MYALPWTSYTKNCQILITYSLFFYQNVPSGNIETLNEVVLL